LIQNFTEIDQSMAEFSDLQIQNSGPTFSHVKCYGRWISTLRGLCRPIMHSQKLREI